MKKENNPLLEWVKLSKLRNDLLKDKCPFSSKELKALIFDYNQDSREFFDTFEYDDYWTKDELKYLKNILIGNETCKTIL